MESHRIAKIALRVNRGYLSSVKNSITYSWTIMNTNIRILFTLRDYLVRSRRFDKVFILFTDDLGSRLHNGTLTGLFGMVNRSEVHVGVRPVVMNNVSLEIVDFSYPYEFSYYTFTIQQPEYEPQVFGIFKTFSLSLWITIFSVLIAMLLIYYVTLKSRYSASKIFLHVLATFLRQSSIVKTSSWVENLLVYSWVIGAMIICMAYDSVFLSFLTFPPVTPIKDISDLATAVKNGEYHCFTFPSEMIFNLMLESEQENIMVIGKNIQNNNVRYEDVSEAFFEEKEKVKLAYLTNTEYIHLMKAQKKYVLEDHFLETVTAMMVSKDFCCKKLIENFVHKLTASGLYLKYKNDRWFLLLLKTDFNLFDRDNNKRKLTLTDVAPAFILLLAGYFTSLLALLGEIVPDRGRKRNCEKKRSSKSLKI